MLSAPERTASAAGRVLQAVFEAVGRLRRGPKALHPRGRVGTARLLVAPTGDPVGVPLLDEPGEHPCLVRLSRALGLRPPLPDVHGLALRVEQRSGQPADLLFASTGSGRLGRFLLVPRRSHASGWLTTLLPMRARGGPLQLGVRPSGPGSFELLRARAAGPWEHCGVLELGPVGDDEPGLRFDPVGRTPDGLGQYDLVRRLRGPSYRR